MGVGKSLMERINESEIRCVEGCWAGGESCWLRYA